MARQTGNKLSYQMDLNGKKYAKGFYFDDKEEFADGLGALTKSLLVTYGKLTGDINIDDIRDFVQRVVDKEIALLRG